MMSMKSFQLLTGIVLAVYATASFADQPTFNRDIRPILSDKCYFCHGPDSETREAGLRLDLAEEAQYVIESGNLLERILSEDPDEVMPPPHTKLELSDEDRRKIKAWIQYGATYENHWAFEPLPDSIAVPELNEDQWPKQRLDRFILRSLREHNLKPNPEAAPHRWLRRVTFDLTGLPPKIDELDSFLAALDQAEDKELVYGAAVDRLLASPAYGEHMAVAWLDAARYADSYGYQSDKLNTQWPYRDWVVKAFNDNLPYDDFITWQLAGDLLEVPTREQRLATAFNRVHRLNNEGGAVFEEWRIENVADRVQTFGTAVLGLTLECCRCHDHKYDPIPMRDYYSMSAFFNSIDENGVYDNTEKVPVPSLLLPTEEQEQHLNDSLKALEIAEEQYQQSVAAANERFKQWQLDPVHDQQVPDLIRSLSFDLPYSDELKDIYYFGVADAYKTKALPTNEVSDVSSPQLKPSKASDSPALLAKKQETSKDGTAEIDLEEHWSRLAVRLNGETGVVVPGIEPFDRWTPFSVSLTLKELNRVDAPAVIVQCSRGQLTFNGWDLTADNGYLEFRMYRVWPGNAIGIRTVDPIDDNQWHQLTATYDGSSTASGLRVFLNGSELETLVVRDKIQKRASVNVMHGGKLTIGQRFRGRGLDGWQIDDFRVYGRALSAAEIEHLASGKPIELTDQYFVSAIDNLARTALAKLTEARKNFVLAEEAIDEIPVMEEMAEPRETHVLARGEYDAPTDHNTRVTRRTFTNIGPDFPDDAPLNRLGLAQWATSQNHPLTSRIIVNRLWGNFFGDGLVRTPENFGLQGELPTHPELLDWLARNFIEDDWDVKQFCRQVVLSATYRQDSRVDSDHFEADPENKRLARGPAFRLSSEQIRDLALASSGLLNDKRGGPPVSPYQAGGDLWRESNTMSPAFRQSVGKDLYRRSLYSVWKRTAPLPNMLAFDAESREVCIVKRARTNTPLQALVLLNDVQFIEASRRLAQNLLTSESETKTQISVAFRSLTGQEPDQMELHRLMRLFESELAHFSTASKSAKQLICVGESKVDQTIAPEKLAAMTIVCQTILNLDATIWRR